MTSRRDTELGRRESSDQSSECSLDFHAADDLSRAAHDRDRQWKPDMAWDQ